MCQMNIHYFKWLPNVHVHVRFVNFDYFRYPTIQQNKFNTHEILGGLIKITINVSSNLASLQLMPSWKIYRILHDSMSQSLLFSV